MAAGGTLIPVFKSAQTSMTRYIRRPNIAIFFTILAVAVSFAWLGVEDPSRWEAGVALYILGRKWSNRIARSIFADAECLVITYQAGLYIGTHCSCLLT